MYIYIYIHKYSMCAHARYGLHLLMGGMGSRSGRGGVDLLFIAARSANMATLSLASACGLQRVARSIALQAACACRRQGCTVGRRMAAL